MLLDVFQGVDLGDIGQFGEAADIGKIDVISRRLPPMVREGALRTSLTTSGETRREKSCLTRFFSDCSPRQRQVTAERWVMRPAHPIGKDERHPESGTDEEEQGGGDINGGKGQHEQSCR